MRGLGGAGTSPPARVTVRLPRVREHEHARHPAATAPVGIRTGPLRAEVDLGLLAGQRLQPTPRQSRLAVNRLKYPRTLQYFLSTPSSTRSAKKRTADRPASN